MEQLTPKQLLLNALHHKETPRAPWVPFAGVHAGKLIGADAQRVLTDEDTLFDALMAVNRLYRPDGQPVMFDLQLEAEILGCELKWVTNNPPSVASHPLQDTMTVPCRCALPTPEDGRMPMVLNVIKRLRAAVGETTALYALYCGPFTLASHLRGNDLFMDMYDDPDYVSELIAFCTDCCEAMTRMYLDAGIDVIAAVDPLVSQISVSHFHEFLTGPYKRLFRLVRDAGRASSFFVCGDATRNIEPMCETAPDAIFVDENVNLKAARAITERHDIALGGNIPLTTVMLFGTQQDNMRYVTDMLDGDGPFRNVIVAPGCDMPYDVPLENAIGVAQAVLQTGEVRRMLKDYVAARDDTDAELPDYAALTEPLVEVFMLDPDSCAACTYMWLAAQRAAAAYAPGVTLKGYRYTTREGIAQTRKMGVKNLPSLYINGELIYSSLIPSQGELEAAIRKADRR